MSENDLELPYLAVIPYAVLSNKNLQLGAKLHYGCLAGLAKKQGYCWATDEQLSKMHEIDLRTIKRWNKSLEDEGFIQRICKNVPYRNSSNKMLWRKERKIYVNNAFVMTPEIKHDPVIDLGRDKNVLSDDRDKNVPSDDRDKNVPSINKESLKEESLKKKRRGKPPSPPLSVSVTPSSDKLFYGSDDLVLLTPEEYEKLKKEYGETRLKEKIEDLNNYIGSKGAKYKSHYSTIKAWFNKNKLDIQPQTSRRKGSKLHFESENTEDTWSPKYATADDL